MNTNLFSSSEGPRFHTGGRSLYNEFMPANFYHQDTITVAKKLLGKLLVHKSREGTTIGKIVETEAYLHHGDEASHSSRGKTNRNKQMFGPAGTAYIYLIYGMYCCLNVVTNKKGIGEAVLIRALEPIEGIELMQKRREIRDLHNLCNGPGKLVIAMGITPDMNGQNLSKKPLYILEGGEKIRQNKIISASRIGISKGLHLPLRFYIKGSSFVSKK